MKKDDMKRLTSMLLGGLLFLFLLNGCGIESAGKEKIISYVLARAEQIESTVSLDGAGAYKKRGPVQEVHDNGTYVDFYCGGPGQLRWDSYAGFYFVPDGKIDTLLNALSELINGPGAENVFTETEGGWVWHGKNGSIVFVVEHIVGSFYYYEQLY